ncbi:hypothetical protein E3L83_05715 [Salmonella enterica]|nr:hypothetical protein [Salmonella enterica]
MATLQADANGTIRGKFSIEAKKFKAGTKQVIFKGSATGDPKTQSHAETTFTGMGTVVTNNLRTVNNVMNSYYDPLAQTFMLDNPRQLSAVEIFLTKGGSTSLIAQLRETTVGFPTRTIVAEGRVEPTDSANYKVGDWTRITFDKPFYAAANTEYAVVILANDADTAVGISELGKRDITTPTSGYVTSQPYQVGVLLSSANASTWTAHQDKDLTFRLICKKYSGKPKVIEMGTVTLPPDTSDLLVSALTTTPATNADADLTLTFSDGSSVTVSDGQVIKRSSVISGDVQVKATLRCTEYASATIEPGSQIIAGKIATTGKYITRRIPVIQTGESKLTVTLEAINPNATDVEWVVAPDINADQAIAESAWQKLDRPANSTLQANGRLEMIFKMPAAAKIPAAAAIILRVTTTGSAASRPMLFNLRASIVEA